MCFIPKLSAQNIGINASGAIPDPSALLDIDGINKGLLIPRVGLVATNNPLPISAPAVSLLVYNTAASGTYPNNVLPGYYYWNGTSWIAFETKQASFNSVDAGDSVTIASTVDVLVSGMTIAPDAGTYVVNFNSQCDMPEAFSTAGINTADLKADLSLIYNDIINLTTTNTTHPLAFGSPTGETIPPGVYSLAGAITVAGILNLDGGGNPNSIFVIRGSGAFDVTAGTIINMINGASPENILWVSETAVGIGANTTIPGTIFSNTAAIAVGTNCTITGRLLTKAGAIAFGVGPLTLPSLPTPFLDFRSLDPFIIFTGSGAVSNTGASTYTGDIGTNLGAITGFDAAGCNVIGTIYQAGSTSIVTPVFHVATFGLYIDGTLIVNSDRTRNSLSAPSDISLHGVATISAGQTINVMYRIDSRISDNGGMVGVRKRILSLTRVR